MENSESYCDEKEKDSEIATNSLSEIDFRPKKMKEVKNMTDKEIFAYVEQLHDLLKKKEKKLRKYKDKIKTLVKHATQSIKSESPNQIENEKVDEAAELAENSTDVVEIKDETSSKTNASNEKEAGDEDEDEAFATAAFSLVDEIRQVAEEAQNLNGFVYEPTSGLYYDHKTGYYYNAEYGLYYDGNSGCYYNYNQEKNAFEFHSQVEVQPNKTTSKTNNENGASTYTNYDNYDSEEDDEDDDVDVQFDEWGGVITDKDKLRQIRKEKDALETKKRRKNKKENKSKSKKSAKRKRAHKTKKRKKEKTESTSNSDSDATSEHTNERKRQKKQQRCSKDIEDGEISDSSSSSTSSTSSCNSRRNVENLANKPDVPIFKSCNRFQDIAKKYPPSLRIIVQETNLTELKVGSLNLITFKGGTLGREGSHDVIIPDVNVSKFHLRFNYDKKKCIYKCIDLGSRNGTMLNGTRMCTSKSESVPHDLVHGSVIQIAQTKLLCHVHEGNSTCGLCEPGLLIERETAGATAADVVCTVALTHKEQLKKLQKKYGLENEKFVDSGKQSTGNYNDRAATRRVQVGSSTDKEKTQTASVNTEISSENKGFKMLAKLGWNKGEALGRTNASAGLLEPINVSTNAGKKGLCCSDDHNAEITSVALTVAEKKKIDTWKKAQERYQKADIFHISDDSS